MLVCIVELWVYCVRKHRNCSEGSDPTSKWRAYLQFIRYDSRRVLVPLHTLYWSCAIHSFWHGPLGVRSAKRRHQSPGWTILSHSYRLIQGEIVWSQVLLDSLHPRSTRTSWWFPPVVQMLLFSCRALSAGQIWTEMYSRLMLSISGLCKTVGSEMVPPCAEWWCEMDNQATTLFGHCPSTAFFSVQPHCTNARRNRCQEDLNSFISSWF